MGRIMPGLQDTQGIIVLLAEFFKANLHREENEYLKEK
jgi:hypothetical protein